MKTPVICHICDFSPEYGGTFIKSLLLLARHCRENLELKMLCIFPLRARNRQWLSQLAEEGVEYGFIPRQRNAMWYVRSLLRDYNPVIFHTHFFLFDLSAILLKSLFYRRAKVIWHYHNEPDADVGQKIKHLLKIKTIFNNVGDRAVAVSHAVHSGMLLAGFTRDKAVLIENGVQINRCLEVQRIHARESIRASLAIEPHLSVFLLLGWDPIRKGVDIFLRAVQVIAKGHEHDCVCLLVGRTATKDFLETEVSHMDIQSSIIRMIEPTADFASLLEAVDVLVSASRNEGLSYAVLEAMNVGKLILSSDLAGVRDTYGTSDGVWMFPSEDWRALSALMIRAMKLSVAERQLLGQSNVQYVEKRHSLDRWAGSVASLYAELLNHCN